MQAYEKQAAIEVIATSIGFELPDDAQVARRFQYDPTNTWRFRFNGTYQNQPASLVVDFVKLEGDEQAWREAFAKQAEENATTARPARTLLSSPFEAARGFGYAVMESSEDAEPLFLPESTDPAKAARYFAVFYRELRDSVTEPFTPEPTESVRAFSERQLETWQQRSAELYPEWNEGVSLLTARLKTASLNALQEKPLRFMHAHLNGRDVRVRNQAGEKEYLVYANHFWSWRQEAYDFSFPLWCQWMAAPKDKRTPIYLQQITEAWRELAKKELSDLIDLKDLESMLLNRLYGSLLLDIPARLNHEDETPESVETLKSAFIAEAERILARQ